MTIVQFLIAFLAGALAPTLIILAVVLAVAVTDRVTGTPATDRRSPLGGTVDDELLDALDRHRAELADRGLTLAAPPLAPVISLDARRSANNETIGGAA